MLEEWTCSVCKQRYVKLVDHMKDPIHIEATNKLWAERRVPLR